MFSESTESSIKSYEESYLKHLENEELESMKINEDDFKQAVERFEAEAESMLCQQDFFERLAAEGQAIDLVVFDNEIEF